MVKQHTQDPSDPSGLVPALLVGTPYSALGSRLQMRFLLGTQHLFKEKHLGKIGRLAYWLLMAIAMWWMTVVDSWMTGYGHSRPSKPVAEMFAAHCFCGSEISRFENMVLSQNRGSPHIGFNTKSWSNDNLMSLMMWGYPCDFGSLHILMWFCHVLPRWMAQPLGWHVFPTQTTTNFNKPA